MTRSITNLIIANVESQQELEVCGIKRAMHRRVTLSETDQRLARRARGLDCRPFGNASLRDKSVVMMPVIKRKQLNPFASHSQARCDNKEEFAQLIDRKCAVANQAIARKWSLGSLPAMIEHSIHDPPSASSTFSEDRHDLTAATF
jgi:hypothetical protein